MTMLPPVLETGLTETNRRHTQTNPQIQTTQSNYREIIGNVFDSSDSIAHCVSADFKMSAGIARKFRRTYPTTYPTNLDHTMNPLFPQWLPESKRYIYHLVTKAKVLQ